MKFNRSNPFRRITTFRICLIKRKFQFVQCSCIAKILTFEIKIRIQVISCVNVSLYSSSVKVNFAASLTLSRP